jgi:RHS repeat-associated protein
MFGSSTRYCGAVVQKGFNGALRKIWVGYNEELRPSGIFLPNGQKYGFFYNAYGDLTRIDLPTGGSIEYDYEPGLEDSTSYCTLYHTPCMPGTYDGFVYNRVVARRLYKENHVLESWQTFSKPGGQGPNLNTNVGYVDKNDYDGNDHLLSSERHFFYGTAESSFAVKGVDYVPWKTGKEYRTEFYDPGGNLMRRIATTWVQRDGGVYWWTGNQDDAPQNDPRVATVVTYLENGLASTTSYGYDPTVSYNSLTDVFNYDFDGSLLNHTHTTYLTTLNGVDYNSNNIQSASSLHMRDFPLQVSVFDNLREYSRRVYEYDNYNTDANHAGLLARPNISGLDPGFGGTYLTRGNITATSNYLITEGVVTDVASAYAQYDVAGNVVKQIDPRGFATTIDYSDRFGAPDGEARGNTAPIELSSVGQQSYAFASSTTNPLGQTTYSQFDYYLGQTVDLEDATGVAGVEDGKGVITSVYFSDSLDRPTRAIRAVNRGAPFKNQMIFSYDDVNRIVTTSSDLSAYNDNGIKSETLYDSLGRTIETRTYENSTQYIAVKTVPFTVLQDPDTGVWVKATEQSNPYRPTIGQQPVWSTSFLDSLGRVTKVRTPDTAIVRTFYDGARALVVDPTGRERLTRTNAIGAPKDVWEITTGDGETESLTFPGRPEVTAGYRTSYQYDPFNRLTRVTQGNLPERVFNYDTLGHLSSQVHPENGTVNYQYDRNGNLIVRTDARGVSSHFSYDEIGRKTREWFNGSNAPTATSQNNPVIPAGVGVSEEVRNFYDAQNLPAGAPSFVRGPTSGKIVAILFGTGTSGDYFGYDATGRQNLKIQQTGDVNYQTTVSYNVSGRITERVYPSGHPVTYSYDSAGRVLGFAGKLGDGTQRNYATGITYSPQGGVTQEQFGTTTPIYNKLFYNVRGQLSEIREGIAPNNTDFERGAIINFYSTCWGMCAGTPMPDNNGNLKRQEYWVQDSGGAVIAINSQDFEYDSLNRLKGVSEGTAWKQKYIYDPYGNRRVDVNNTTASLLPTAFEVQANANRLLAPGDSNLPEANRQMRYDAAGNLTTDYYTGQGQRSYDAENHMTQAWANGQWQTYTYDANGKRVRRNVNGVETWDVYGLGGELIAEYPASGAAANPQKEYGYRNGQLLITAGSGAPTAPPPSSLAAAPSSGGGNVVLSWSAAAGATNYRIERKGATGAFVLAGTTASTTLTDTAASAGSAYLYRVCAANGQGQCTSAFSNIALGAAISFLTDPNITSSAEDPTGVNVTKVKVAHITELRTAVNSVRLLAGLSAAQWTNQTLTATVSVISADDVRDLRLKLGEALTALGIQTSNYDDQNLAGAPNGTLIKKVHITQLRQRSTSGTGGSGGTNPGQFGVQWLVMDQLGTPRMVFDETGSLASSKRHDYLPFGEVLVAGNRATTPGYDLADGVRQKFTGYEHDDETQLEFAQARYLSNRQGRFTGVDPMNGVPTDPQTWNRYSYVGNNPVNLTDPTGTNYFVGGGVVDPFIKEYRVDGFDMGPEGTTSQLTSESMLSYSPNGFLMNEGMAVTAPTQQQQQTILIVVGDPGLRDHNTGLNLNRAAETKRAELEERGFRVIVVRASSDQDFANALVSNGRLDGVEVVAHGSWDAIHFGEQLGGPTNLEIGEVGTLSNANLNQNAYIKLNSCYTASGGPESIAQAISNQLQRTTLAFDGGTIFSGNERSRVTIWEHGKEFPPKRGPIYLIEDRGTRLHAFTPNNR